jgi:S-DNA-T family DNA segregation ATPase FtsK/SpoIIIE
MAPRKSAKQPVATAFEPRSSNPRPFVGIFFLILAVLATLALGDYSPEQNPLYHSDPSDTNLIGYFGVRLSHAALYSLGLGAYGLPLLGFWMAYMFFRPFAGRIKLRKLPPILILFIGVSVFAALYQIETALALPAGAVALADLADNRYPFGDGGWLGYHLYGQFLRTFLGMVGTLVVFGILSLFALAFLLIDNLAADASTLIKARWADWRAGKGDRSERKKARLEAAIARKKAKAEAKEKAAREREAKALQASEAESAQQAEKANAPLKESGRTLSLPKREDDTPIPFAPIVEEATTRSREEPFEDSPPPSAKPPAKGPLTLPKETAKKRASKKPGLNIIESDEVRKAGVELPEKKGDYSFPPMRLLVEGSTPKAVDDASVHQETAENLVRTLDEFGVKVTTGDVHTGPVITRYDVYPAAGVRVERILNLDKNIALNLKALSVRILAPVPGKGCVGIEVPNKHPQSVYIRDILESEDWAAQKAEIPIALGKEVSGRPLIADLTKMPHLLIAGSTGSGKTVCINSVITSLLYHSSPEDLRFVMVDPKIVEMQVFNALPHMMVPVVTDPKKVPNALKHLLNEMERRYQLFAGMGVRNIAGYNARMAKNRKEAREAEERAAAIEAEMTPEERAATASIEVPRDPSFDEAPPEKLPYIVCFVDELADLMMVAPADIETGITRLAQLARAAGIHLILATQRPSVNVITGVIKANLPSRIAFKVASKVDSRTILDTGGADHLIGKGDMLFLPPGSPDLVRAQGAFVSDEEITRIVENIRENNGQPVFDEIFQRSIESGETPDSGTVGEFEDDLVPDAIEVIRNSKRASTSLLQRRLKIGYNRAARIMELLEAEGIVGPENGSSPREILIDTDG